MSAPGGFRLRQFEAELDMLSSPEETVLRHRRAQLLADYVRDNIALRLPLPDILRYAIDSALGKPEPELVPVKIDRKSGFITFRPGRQEMPDWPRVRARLYHLVNEQHRGDRASVPPE